MPRPGRCRLPTPTAHQPRPSAFSDPDYLDRPGSAPRRPPPITDSAGPDFSFLPTPFPPGTLANARAYTKRLFLLSFAQSIFPAGQHKRPASNTEASAERGEGGGMALGDAGSRPPTRRDRGGTVMAGAVRPHTANGARPASARSIDDELALSISCLANEKPVASGNGVSISIALAEPLLYLQGFDQNDSTSGNTTMLRGSMLLKVTKPAKLKSVSLTFRGKSETDWPEGKGAFLSS